MTLLFLKEIFSKQKQPTIKAMQNHNYFSGFRASLIQLT
jgi:hypothetical protein